MPRPRSGSGYRKDSSPTNYLSLKADRQLVEGVPFEVQTTVENRQILPWEVRQWLTEWEERQRLELQLHEDSTKELLRESVKTLLEQLRPSAGLKAAGLKGFNAPKLAVPLVEAGLPEKDPAFSPCLSGISGGSGRSGRSARSKASKSQTSPQGSSCFDQLAAMQIPPEPKAGMPGYEPRFNALGEPPAEEDEVTLEEEEAPKARAVHYHGLNQAMISACGCAKGSQVMGATSTVHPDDPHEDGSGVPSRIPIGSARYHLWRVAHHSIMGGISGTAVFAYAIVCGFMANQEMAAAVEATRPPTWRYYVDLTFTGIFFVEVMFRILVMRKYYFTREEWKWNVFDCVVAWVGVMDLLTIFNVSLSFLRVLRTFRAVRVLRVIRIFRFFKELRLMVASILCCLVSLSWAFILLLSVMYIFAVVLLQGASDHLQHAEVPEKLREVLSDDFGGLPRAIYSLIQAVSGGRSWGEFAEPFIQISPFYGIAFAVFIVFVIFGLLNILTGIFVESTSCVASFDKELVIQEEMSRSESVVSQIRQLFTELDADHSGTLTYQELKANLKDQRVRAYFSVLQMDVSEAHGLFQLLDRDESGEVSIEEFIMTCQRLKGGARSIDLAGMLFESKRFHTFIKHFMTSIKECVLELQTSVHTALLHEGASLQSPRGSELQ